MKKGDIMAGLNGYSSYWSLGLYIGGERDNNNEEEKEVYISPYDDYAQAMKQESEQKRQIRENPEVRKYVEYEIDRLKRSIEDMKMMLKALEVRYRKQVAYSCCPAQLTFEYSESYSRIEKAIRHSESVLHSKEKLLHDALNM